MYCFIPSSHQRKLGYGIAVIAMAVSTLTPSTAYAGEEGKDAKASIQPAQKQEMTGADLYAINCNRCHEERFPKEFTAAQWTTIMLHMRVRANLTASESKKIVKYLQSQAGN